MRKIRTNKGITLIALIITIIILLILAVVSIRLVVNNGILGKAEYATQKYSEEEAAEQEKLLKAEYEMAKYEGKFSGTYPEYLIDKKYPGLKIGDYVAYDATTDAKGNAITGDKATYTSYSVSNASTDKNEGRSSGYTSNQVFNLSSYTGGWRVLGVKNGQLKLISSDIIGPDSGGYTDSTNGNKYYLKGRKGYTDGPGELNAISAMYGQGKGAESARSVTVKDINDITGYKPEETGDGKPFGSGTMNEYNNKVTYYWDGTNYPYYEYGEGENQKNGNLAGSHSTSFNWYDGTNWQRSAKNTDASKEAKSRITDLTSNYYFYYPTTLTTSDGTNIKGIAKTCKEWEVLFKDTSSKKYWLASPNVYCNSDYPHFCVRGVSNGSVDSGILFYPDGYSDSDYNGVRPVVSLKSDIQIEKTETNDGSTLEKACIIK